MPAPRMEFTISATRLQRPMVRTRPVSDSAKYDSAFVYSLDFQQVLKNCARLAYVVCAGTLGANHLCVRKGRASTRMADGSLLQSSAGKSCRRPDSSPEI